MLHSTLRVRVNPKSARNQVVALKDGVLHLKLTAPPVEGAANKACAEFLAHVLGLRKSQINLMSGDKSREKVFCIENVSQESLDRLVQELIVKL